METHAIPLTGRILFAIVLPLAIAVGAFVALSVIGRIRRGANVVPGLLGAAALAPTLATYYAVRLIIGSLQELAGSGGIGAVSAALWEATQPLIYTSWGACVLCIIAAVIAITPASRLEAAGAPAVGREALGIGVVAIAIVAVAVTNRFFLATSQTIVHVIDPNAQQTASLTDVAQNIASRLVITAGTAVAMSIVLVVAIFVSALLPRKGAPAPTHSRVFAFFALAAAAGTIPMILAYRAWAARLYETAITGQFPR